MSRSRKKNPVVSVTCCGMRAGAMHSWKKENQRSFRRRVRVALARGDEWIPTLYEVTNGWTSPADGKMWWDGEPWVWRK